MKYYFYLVHTYIIYSEISPYTRPLISPVMTLTSHPSTYIHLHLYKYSCIHVNNSSVCMLFSWTALELLLVMLFCSANVVLRVLVHPNFSLFYYYFWLNNHQKYHHCFNNFLSMAWLSVIIKVSHFTRKCNAQLLEQYSRECKLVFVRLNMFTLLPAFRLLLY